jgi:hypothetical protein
MLLQPSSNTWMSYVVRTPTSLSLGMEAKQAGATTARKGYPTGLQDHQGPQRFVQCNDSFNQRFGGVAHDRKGSLSHAARAVESDGVAMLVLRLMASRARGSCWLVKLLSVHRQ